MTGPTIVAWRIGRARPLRCIVVGKYPGQGNYGVRAGIFSRETMTVPMADVFFDHETCRAEIQRRADATKETTDGA